jgi:hypothetical protein
MRRGAVLRKRRRLSTARAPGRVQLPPQAVVLPAQPLDLLAQRLPFTLGSFGALTPRGIVRSRPGLVRAGLIWHIEVMPDPRKKYKSNHVEFVI